MVVSEWRLVTIANRPAYYVVAIGFQCSHCQRITGWGLTKNTMPLDWSRPLDPYPVHEL